MKPMQVVEFDSGNELPLTYEPDILKDYYGKRPLLALRRLVQVRSLASIANSPPASHDTAPPLPQVASAASVFGIPFLWDVFTGQVL